MMAGVPKGVAMTISASLLIVFQFPDVGWFIYENTVIPFFQTWRDLLVVFVGLAISIPVFGLKLLIYLGGIVYNQGKAFWLWLKGIRFSGLKRWIIGTVRGFVIGATNWTVAFGVGFYAIAGTIVAGLRKFAALSIEGLFDLVLRLFYEPLLVHAVRWEPVVFRYYDFSF